MVGLSTQAEERDTLDSCVTMPCFSHNYLIHWGEYEPAIRRWEHVLGRPAPDPTEPNRNGNPRLTASFDEWMMGLPEGWITDSDIPHGAKIKLGGNGVVPQQAESALRRLLSMEVPSEGTG